LDATEVRAAFQSTKGVAVPPSAGFAAWAAEHPFAEGEDGPEKDPDGDGLANGMEWLFGSDPLDGTDGAVPAGEILDAEEIGLDDGQRYFGFRARVRKERPGVTLVPEGVSDPADFGTPEAASAVRQAGPPVDDGGFEIFTWHLKDPIGESPRGFMRLRIVVE